MDPEYFENLMTTLLISGLVLYMGFIVWDLAKQSKAGQFGTFILFFCLGLGVFGFIAKEVIISGLHLTGL